MNIWFQHVSTFIMNQVPVSQWIFARFKSWQNTHNRCIYLGQTGLLTWLLGAKELWGDTGPNRLPSLAALIPREVEQTYWPRRAVACVSFTGDKNDGTKNPGVKGNWCFLKGIWQGCVIPRTDQQTQQTSGQGNASCQHVHLHFKRLKDIFQKTDHMIRTMLSPKVS